MSVEIIVWVSDNATHTFVLILKDECDVECVLEH